MKYKAKDKKKSMIGNQSLKVFFFSFIHLSYVWMVVFLICFTYLLCYKWWLWHFLETCNVTLWKKWSTHTCLHFLWTSSDFGCIIQEEHEEGKIPNIYIYHIYFPVFMKTWSIGNKVKNSNGMVWCATSYFDFMQMTK